MVKYIYSYGVLLFLFLGRERRKAAYLCHGTGKQFIYRGRSELFYLLSFYNQGVHYFFSSFYFWNWSVQPVCFPFTYVSPCFKSLIKNSLFILILYSWSLAGEVTWPYIREGVQYKIKTKATFRVRDARQIQSGLNNGDQRFDPVYLVSNLLI